MVFTSQLPRTSFLMICVPLLNGQNGQIAPQHAEKDLNLGFEDFSTGNITFKKLIFTEGKIKLN